MERIKAYYPSGTENIFHIGKKGNRYRLDAIEIPIRIKERLLDSEKFEVVVVNGGSDSVLKLAHSKALISAYETGKPIELANSSGLMWQDGFYEWVINKASATIKAANEAVLSGKSLAITSGGHHAEHDFGRGFGPISNMVIAAKELLGSGTVKKVAILDLDVHYANGTHSQVVGDDRILSCDLWKYKLDKWLLTPNGENICHFRVQNSNDYFNKLNQVFRKIIDFSPDLLFLYDGLDPLQNDRMGGVPGFDEQVLNKRDRMVGSFIVNNKYPTCLFIGGGYVDYSKGDNEIEKSKNHLVELFVQSINTSLSLDP